MKKRPLNPTEEKQLGIISKRKRLCEVKRPGRVTTDDSGYRYNCNQSSCVCGKREVSVNLPARPYPGCSQSVLGSRTEASRKGREYPSIGNIPPQS